MRQHNLQARVEALQRRSQRRGVCFITDLGDGQFCTPGGLCGDLEQVCGKLEILGPELIIIDDIPEGTQKNGGTQVQD